MAPGKTDQLVKQLRQWYETHAMPQKALALTLGFTPQGLSEIFAGRNRPTGEQTLRMLEFLNENMKSETIALPNLRTVRDDDEHLDLLNGKPKTLGAAKEMIDGLRTQLRSAPVAAPQAATITAPTVAKRETLIAPKVATGLVPNDPPPQAPPTNPSDLPGFKRVQSDPPPPAKLLPKSADTPVLIQKILDGTNFADLVHRIINR